MQISTYIRDKLIKNGFSEGEALVYVNLLATPGVTASFLRKKTGLSLAGIYKIMDALVSKGVVIVDSLKPAKYTAVGTSQLAKKFENAGRKMQRIAEKLKTLPNLSNASYEAEIYEDEDLFNQYLNIPSQIDDFIWCVGSFEAVVDFFGKNVENEFIKKRCKNGIFADAIIFDNSEHSKELAGRDKGEKRETKLMEIKNYPLDFDYLFGDTYINFHRDNDGNLRMIKAKSKNLARAKLLQYQVMWNTVGN